MIVDDINKAISTGSVIEIKYTKSDGSSSVRKLSDVEYSREYGESYISAFCHMRQERRTFKINRITSVVFLSGDEEVCDTPVQQEPINHESSAATTYPFNPNKRIFNLYGEDYNF